MRPESWRKPAMIKYYRTFYIQASFKIRIGMAMSEIPSIGRSALFAKIALIISIFVLINGPGIGYDVQAHDKAKWVIMVYMAADNNLEPASVFSMNQLERVGSDENIQIVVQWDRSPGYDSSNGNWSGTKRFLISKDDDDLSVRSLELEDLGEADMGDVSTLAEFVNWTNQRYPAARRALVMWNHGGGWTPHTFDDTSNTYLTLSSLSHALRAAGIGEEDRLDLLIFDECLMGLIDVAHEMRPYAKVMIASEDVVPALGIDYVVPLSGLAKDPNMDESELAKSIVLAYEEFYTKEVLKPFVTLAAYDLEKMPDVINAADRLSFLLRDHMDDRWPQIGISLSFSEAFSVSDGLAQFKLQSNYYDLFDFADLIGEKNMDRQVNMAADELKEAIRSSTIAEFHGDVHPFAHGLTAYFPEDESLYSENYQAASRFASDTGWNELLRGYIAAEVTDEIAPAIDIDSISPHPSNVSNPARIMGNATGNNIAYISRSIGKVEESGFTIFNEHPLYRYYAGYAGERRLPEFVDGRNNIDFTWAPTLDVLTNGKRSVIAPAFPLRGQDYYFTVTGKYKSADEPDRFSARLSFDYRTGKMMSAVSLDDMQINEFETEAGDAFWPESSYYDKKTDEIRIIELGRLTVGDCGIWLEPRLLTDGIYAIGLYVEDLSGNGNWTWESIDIAGQPSPNASVSVRDIVGKWTGYGPYESTQFAFEFSDRKLSEEDKQISRTLYDLEYPSCSIWRLGQITIRAPGKDDKISQFAYRLKSDEGFSWLTVILFPEGQPEPVYMAFLISLNGDELHMRDIFQSGEYSLRRSGTLSDGR